jgi:hypothetical protein
MKFIPNWLKNLLSKSKPQDPHHTREYIISNDVTHPFSFKVHQKLIPQHNNRKSTRGRRIQYIDIGRSQRPIYHNAS